MDKNVMIYEFVFDLNAINMYRHDLINKEFVFFPELKDHVTEYLRDISRNSTVCLKL
jgi:hypothetical protein